MTMTRIDHYLNPAAPAVNSIVVAVSVFVPDDEGRVLMVRRADNDLYTIPGGKLEIGETTSVAAARVTRRVAGVDVKVVGLVGVYSDPGHVVEFSDGEVRQEFSVCFRAEVLGGEVHAGENVKEAHWVRPDAVDSLIIHPSIKLRVRHGFDNRAKPYYS